jgi:hypothetical protein
MGAVVINVIFAGRWLFVLMMLIAQLLGEGV